MPKIIKFLANINLSIWRSKQIRFVNRNYEKADNGKMHCCGIQEENGEIKWREVNRLWKISSRKRRIFKSAFAFMCVKYQDWIPFSFKGGRIYRKGKGKSDAWIECIYVTNQHEELFSPQNRPHYQNWGNVFEADESSRLS